VSVLYLDCFSGAAGDMILGALIDAGLPLDDLRGALGSLAVNPDDIWTERVTRGGVSATKFHVLGEEPPVDPGVDHDHRGHSHHPSGAVAVQPAHPATHTHGSHRTLANITRLIEGSALSASGKERAVTLFRRLGNVEAAIHGTSVDTVRLHELGALDSIIDIVGTVYALEALNIDQVVASPINVGSGTIRTAHGMLPVPAPATARLLEGAPIYSGTQRVELVTPTGALLVTAYAETFGGVPPMRLQRVGYGAGSRDFPDSPNVLRVLIGEADRDAPSHRVVIIEAEIDDMNPQIFGVVMERLLADGALDVFYTSIQMKKNRPGTLLSIVAPPHARERLTAIVFRETTTIGVRFHETDRECLERETVSVQTPFGPVRIKVARRQGAIMNAAPEFEDCASLAAASGRAVKEIQAAATKAFLDHEQQ
jgi:uncharacterized protein (TIGR00299 family) protein